MAIILKYVSPGVATLTDESGASTQVTFTDSGQVKSITDPLNRVTQLEYNADNYLTKVTTPANTTYGYNWDSQGQLLSQTDTIGNIVSFDYKKDSELIQTVTDQKGIKTGYSYDAKGNIVAINYVDGTSESFQYDADNQLIKATDRSGDTFQFSYDADSNLIKRTLDDGTSESFTYDKDGNLTSAKGSSGTISIKRGALGSSDPPGSSNFSTTGNYIDISYPNGRSIHVEYDLEGRRTQIVDQDGFAVKYSYSSSGQLTKLTNEKGATIASYNYDVVGRLIKEANGNGTYTTYSYDQLGQITKISNHAKDDSINSSFQYTYDSLGQQKSVTTLEGTWTYSYDAIGQLTRALFDSTKSGVPNQDLTYVYDAAGNRTQTIINGVTTNYTANNLNQYLTVANAKYTFDPDGNLTQVVDGSKTYTYTYNNQNQLIKANTPSGTWTYEYDAFGSRTASVHNGQRVEYLVDPFGLGNVIGEYSGSGQSIAKYTYGAGLTSRVGTGGTAAYYDFDRIGSAVGLTSGSGNYVNRYSYLPFGESLTTVEGVANPFEFVGQWGVMGDASNLDYMRARYYSPELGRFTADDPLGFIGSGTNLYRYALNSPSNFIDPLGLEESAACRFAEGLKNRRNALEDLARNAGNPDAFDDALDRYQDSNQQIRDSAGGFSEKLLDIFVGSLRKPSPTGAAKKLGKGGLKTLWDLAKGGGLIPGVPGGDGCGPRKSAPYAPDAAGKAGQSQRLFDPLVLDLDNDGVELISVANSKALFDLDADGFAEQTGWVKADDGMLALDANGDGKINNITELFGDASTDGFVELATLDSKRDGVIDASDTQFGELKIWQDANENGTTQAGEIKSLAQLGIVSIKLNPKEASVPNEGNLIRSISKFTRSDGSKGEAVALWFSADQLNTEYNQPFQLKPEALFLPTARGYSKLPDLFISISLDSQLLGLVRQLASLNIKDLGQAADKVTAILYRWAGVDSVDPNSRGGLIDARKLAFLDAFLGTQNLQPFNYGDPTRNEYSVKLLQDVWLTILRETAVRLVAQGPLSELFSSTAFDVSQDLLSFTNSTDRFTNLSDTLDRLSKNVPIDSTAAARYWSFAVSALNAHQEFISLPPEEATQYESTIKSALKPIGLSDYLDALRHPVFGSNGSDTLRTDDIGSFFDGGAGNDIIYGSGGSDLIYTGSGNDKIYSYGPTDQINAGTGTDELVDVDFLTPTDLVINDSGQPINIDGVQITGIERFTKLTSRQGNDQINFTQVWDNNISTGQGDDVVHAGGGNDTVNGEGGNNTLDGGDGDDHLILNLSAETLPISITQPTTGLSIPGVVNATNFESFTVTGGTGNDLIALDSGNDTINGGEGNDTLKGGAGNDIIYGIAGQDIVDGGEGTDVLLDSDFVADFSTSTSSIVFNKTISQSITVKGKQIQNVEQLINLKTGNGNDQIDFGLSLNNTLSTGAGNDIINSGQGADSLNAGTGSDLLILNYTDADLGSFLFCDTTTGDGSVSGSSSNNITSSVNFQGVERFQITTGAGNDSLTGGKFSDTFNTGAGNDTLDGGIGNDTLNGGAGNDSITALAGVDKIDGGTGTDTLETADFSSVTTAMTFDDTGATHTPVTLSNGASVTNVELFTNLTTGSSNDKIDYTRNVSNTLSTGAGNDIINPGQGADSLNAGTGSDLLILNYTDADLGSFLFCDTTTGDGSVSGSSSNNITSSVNFQGVERFQITTGAGNDSLTGGKFSDTFNTGAGNDTLDGGVGNDTLNGGAGNDQLTGNGGADKFLYNTNAAFTSVAVGKDTITDFSRGLDKIVLDKTTFKTLSSAAGGALLAAEFASVANDSLAGTVGSDVVYSRATDKLFYNQNGAAAGFGTGTQFATLSGIADLAATDFLIQV